MPLSSDEASTTGGPGALEIGTYPARLIRVVDLGVQEYEYNKQLKRSDQINVTFELMDEYITDDDGNPDTDNPRVLSCFLKLYKGAKRGNNVDFCAALDPTNEYGGHWGRMQEARLPCLLNVELTETGKNKIANISPPMKGQEFRDCKVEGYVFDTAVTKGQREVWEKLPEWIQDQIKQRKDPNEVVKYEKTEAQVAAAQSPPAETVAAASDESDSDDIPW